tara:strand:+ start:124 stop:453 length:330 start_codon:yes stop_codon:yes gene_type:complete
MVKQISLDTWSVQHLTELLRKASLIVTKTNSPIILYRQTLEEEEGSYEEIVCTLTDTHVIEQVIISGGVIAPNINQQFVFSIDEFSSRLLRKSKDLFLHVVQDLEENIK